jgi:hypothetical protein
MTRYLVLPLLLTASLFLASPPSNAQSVPTAEQLDASLRSCAGQKKIDVDADVSGAIKESWEGNILRGKAKIDQFGHIILSFKDETLRLKAYDLYTKCLKDYLDRFSRGQYSQTSNQQKTQSSIEKGYESSNAAERAEAIRAAFEAVSVFGVALEADWSLVDELDKKRYATELPRCEQILSRPINFYSRETGKFSEKKDFPYGTFQGQVSGQSIRFGGIGYGGVSYSGNLVNTGNDWKFTGLVTCGSNGYKAVFQLR